MQSTSIDLSGLSPTGRAKAISFINELFAQEEFDNGMMDVLDNGTDAEIMEWTMRNYFSAQKYAITVASVYDDDKDFRYSYDPVRELCPTLARSRHPRRPMIMKGSLRVLCAKYCRTDGGSNSNGYAARVGMRYIRAYKFTFTDQVEFYRFLCDLTHRLCKKLNAKFDYVIKHIDRVSNHHRGDTLLVGGKFSYFNASETQNIKRLHNIIKKTEKLDERVKLLRETSRLRSA